MASTSWAIGSRSTATGGPKTAITVRTTAAAPRAVLFTPRLWCRSRENSLRLRAPGPVRSAGHAHVIGMAEFVHLHTHTEHSLLDGANRIADLVEKVGSDGAPAVAITDHGSLAGALRLANATQGTGIKPILGEEIYLSIGSRHSRIAAEVPGDLDSMSADADPAASSGTTKRRVYEHLTLLAATPTGWSNLVQVQNAAESTYWYKARADLELLAQHSDGLIALTGCLAGPVAGPLARGDRAGADQGLGRLVDTFGRDNVYVEVMDHGIGAEHAVLEPLLELAKAHRVGVVATNDSHHTHAADARAHDALLCLQAGSVLSAEQRFRFNGGGYHLRTAAEMYAICGESWWRDAVAASVEIAERIAPDVLGPANLRLPTFPLVPAEYGGDSAKYLHDLVLAGALERYGEDPNRPGRPPAHVGARLRTEFGVYKRMGVVDYCLIVWEMVSWARSRGILIGPGRGCLTGDALVWTPQGYVPIDQIEVGDTVRTHTGALREVTATFVYDVAEELTTLRTYYDGVGATMTPDHKVLAVQGRRVEDRQKLAQGYRWDHSVELEPRWVAANVLTEGDLLCVPRPPSPGTAPARIDMRRVIRDIPRGTRVEFTETEVIEHVPTSKPYPHSVHEVSRCTGLARNVIQRIVGTYPDEGPLLDRCGRRATAAECSRDRLVTYLRANGFASLKDWDRHVHDHATIEVRTPRFVAVDDDLCFMLGAWASNGWLRNPEKSLRVVGFAEKASTRDETIPLLVKRIWGLGVVEHIHAQRDVAQYTVKSLAVRALIAHLAAGYRINALTKHLPDWIRDLDIERKRAVLDGLWWGDGSTSGGRWQYSTSSPRLMTQVRDLLWAVGAPAGCDIDDRTDLRAEFANRARSWRIRTTPGFGPPPPACGYVDARYVYQRVRQVSTETVATKVYDFTVPVDHSYMTDSYAVHNSAPGSAIMYCLGVTQIEPLSAGLLFERFLDPDRDGMPDVDTDFERGRRHEVVEHLVDLYGADMVARIGTRGVMRTKAAIKDASRVLELSTVGSRLADLVPLHGATPMTLTQLNELTEETAPFHAAVQASGEDAHQILDIARTLEGVTRSESIHPCGVLISNEPMTGLVPMRYERAGGEVLESATRIAAWDGPDLERRGFLKLDALGLRNLDVVALAATYIEQSTGEHIDVDRIAPDGGPRDQATWEMLAQGRTAGLFQLESEGIAELARQVAPETMEDLTALVALYRPGPMAAGMHTRYADRKNGREPVSYDYLTTNPAEAAVIASVLDVTYASVVYQEQLQMLGLHVAGLDASWRNQLRRAFSKKKADLMAKVREVFFDGGRRGAGPAGVRFSEATLENLWTTFEGSASYLFNKSHSAAYGRLAYVTAYLSANWPVEYGAAILATTASDTKRASAIRSLRAQGIEVVAPDVNESWSISAPVRGRVVIGLGEVKGVASTTAAAIVAERERCGSYAGLGELLRRVTWPHPKTGKPTGPSSGDADALIEAGAFDAFGPRLGQRIIVRSAARFDPLVPGAKWGILERANRQRARLGFVVGEHPLAVRSRDVAAVLDRTGRGRTALWRVDEAPDRARLWVVAMLAAWAEKPYSRGMRAGVVLEASDGRQWDAVMWDDALRVAKEREQVPDVGQVVRVGLRVRRRTVMTEVVDESDGSISYTKTNTLSLSIDAIETIELEEATDWGMPTVVPDRVVAVAA